MRVQVGEVAALWRYSVKSMRGESCAEADLGWHGLAGDRRLAFRRLGEPSGFPWLSATRLPALLLYAPVWRDSGVGTPLPTHVRTPDGNELPLFGRELATEVGRRLGTAVEMMYLDRGIFDEASVSVITTATVDAIALLAAERPDARRFRPNILIAREGATPYEEDAWVGGVLSFGEGPRAPAIAVTNRDERCAMVNLDPDTAHPAPQMLKAIVRTRDNKLGVYGATTHRGRVEVGQRVFFTPAAPDHVE